MTMSVIETEFLADLQVWVDFARLTCDVCGATDPPDGTLSEFPCVLYDALAGGWQVMPITGLACCPECHQRIVDEESAR